MVSTDTHDNPYSEWTQDVLTPPSLTNAFHEGQDVTGDDSVVGTRVGNHSQISVKIVSLSSRVQNTNNIGRSNELAYQVMRRQQELRRDVEAIALSNQASQKSVADANPPLDDTKKGLSAGLPSWLTSNVVLNSTGGAVGGFGATTGDIVDATTPGEALPVTEEGIRDVAEQVYNEGGEASILMTVPGLCRKISEYLFTAAARVATLQSDQGKSEEKATALGAVNVFVSDFATLTFVPNRLQQTYDDDTAVTPLVAADVFIIDPMYCRLSYLEGYRTEPLAKTGLSDKRQMCVDWTFKMLTEKGCGMILAADTASTMLDEPAGP